METQYNGWTNKPTWLVNIWYGDFFHQLKEEGETITAESMESYVSDNYPVTSNGFNSDMFTYVLALVNWHELEKTYKEESE